MGKNRESLDIKCPACQSSSVKYGKRKGWQIYRCKNLFCKKRTFNNNPSFYKAKIRKENNTKCPKCGTNTVKFGLTPKGQQRYRCRNNSCRVIFMEEHDYLSKIYFEKLTSNENIKNYCEIDIYCAKCRQTKRIKFIPPLNIDELKCCE